MNIQPSHIHQMVTMAGQFKDAHMMSLLNAILKVNGIIMKKNQLNCIKMIMQTYKTTAYVLNISQQERY